MKRLDAVENVEGLDLSNSVWYDKYTPVNSEHNTFRSIPGAIWIVGRILWRDVPVNI